MSGRHPEDRPQPLQVLVHLVLGPSRAAGLEGVGALQMVLVDRLVEAAIKSRPRQAGLQDTEDGLGCDEQQGVLADVDHGRVEVLGRGQLAELFGIAGAGGRCDRRWAG
jgi:hypothetical protein